MKHQHTEYEQEIDDLLKEYRVNRETAQQASIDRNDDPFDALDGMREILEKQGYACGPLCRDLPVMIVENADRAYLGKWDRTDHNKMVGVLLSRDFRHGPVHAVFFR